jgi:hypothetical protein
MYVYMCPLSVLTFMNVQMYVHTPLPPNPYPYRNAFENVASKYQDVLVLEASVAELHQMFLDFALLTEEQVYIYICIYIYVYIYIYM